MAYEGSEASPTPVYLPQEAHQRVKILVAGPLGIGKTTAVSTLSEIPPLHTEELMTQASVKSDDLDPAGTKETTTVAIDFGRLTLPGVVLYLYGTPGQPRFLPLWKELALGALGALVLVDTRRLDQSFEVMDVIEDRGLDYAVAVNAFPSSPDYPLDTLRARLDLDGRTPLVTCDVRDKASTLDALITLVEHLSKRAGADHDQ